MALPRIFDGRCIGVSTKTYYNQVFNKQGQVVSEEIVVIDSTIEDNDRTLRERAQNALANNNTFMNLTAPTNAQNAAQIKALTRQMNAIIRLVVGALDNTD